jgi:hypothetical protein
MKKKYILAITVIAAAALTAFACIDTVKDNHSPGYWLCNSSPCGYVVDSKDLWCAEYPGSETYCTDSIVAAMNFRRVVWSGGTCDANGICQDADAGEPFDVFSQGYVKMNVNCGG